jgi:uncharacterized lipoprotein YmbA
MKHTYALFVSKRGCGSLVTILCALALTGCFGLMKPAQTTTRHFVLNPIAAPEPRAEQAQLAGIGIGRIKLPAYLFEREIAVRKQTSEVAYLEKALWAERLDIGVQRVLAANLSFLLPTRQVRASAWSTQDTAAEVYVTIEQFDTDSKGRSVLAARWRVVSAGGQRTLNAGETFLSRQGASPESDPAGAVASLSALLADFSRELSAVLEKTSVQSAAVFK